MLTRSGRTDRKKSPLQTDANSPITSEQAVRKGDKHGKLDPKTFVDLTGDSLAEEPSAKRQCTSDHADKPVRGCTKWDTSCRQQEPFTRCIKNTIDQYGGGPIFLKEMLSNADDAGATSFHVLLDKTEYTTENLLDKSMQDMQQASLLVANDSVFSNSNLHEYNDAGASGKANDSSTGGRFGKGKLTAYIITDTIQLLTGSNLLFIDPHETRLPNRPQQMRTDIVSRNGFHPDDKVLSHLEPFRKATASWPALKPWTPGEHYPGTVFRLALRTPEAAAVSQISQKATTADELQADTLTKFCCVAPDLLLFTKSVSTISVYVKESADSEAELLHTCTVDRQSLDSPSGHVELKQLTVTAKTAAAQQGNESACKIWIVATKGTPGLGPNQEPLLYAAVAALLHEGPAGSEAAKLEIPYVQGRLHSKMPLPFESPGLPVHIDSYFEVYADRRKMCSGDDDWGKGDKNKELLTRYVAPAWVALLAVAKEKATTPADLYRLWLPTPKDLPSLEPLAEAAFQCLVKTDSKLLWAPSETQDVSGRWASPSEACFLPPLGAPDAPSPLLIKVARRAGLLVPDLPALFCEEVQTALVADGKSPKVLTPAVLRHKLREAGNILQPAEVDDVLMYVFADRKFLELDQLYLVRLRNDTVQQLRCKTSLAPQQSLAKEFYSWRAARSEDCFKLLWDSNGKQVVDSPAWRLIAEHQHEHKFVLDEGLMNIQLPTIKDVASSFPASWLAHSGLSEAETRLQPSPKWLQRFWAAAVAHQWERLPAEFNDFNLVLLKGGRLVSAASCKAQSALTPAHLDPFLKGQPQITYLLSKLGCWCIVNPKASMVAQLSGTQEPVLAALTAAAQSKDMPLQQFVSEQNLGPIDFCSICQMLLNIKTSSANRRHVTDFLSQCTLFEDMHGKQLSLAQQPDVRVVPFQAWEQSIAASPDLLPWTVIKYHSATKTQQELLKKAGRGDVDTIKFLDDLLRELYSSASVALDPEQQVKLEHLLGQVVSTLASEPTARLQQPLQLLVGGRLQRVKMLVDSSSSLLKDLFSKDSGYTEYELLPDEFAQGEWLSALKAHGLKHEDYPDADFFLTCADQVVRLHNGKELSDSIFNHSETLLKMLQRNLASYKAAESRPSEWDEIMRRICAKPICVKTVSMYPYETRPGSRMVSLQDSVDYSHYRMVANAKVITSPTFNTCELRTALGLPAAPQAMDVITHLVQIAKSRNGQLRSLQVPPVGELDQRIQQDVHEAYSCIVKSVSHYLALPSEQPAELARMTQKLAAVPWVMDPHSQRFLKASELMFTIVEGDEQAVQVPPALQKLLVDKPEVKKWMIVHLHMKDLQDGAPAVRPLPSPPVHLSKSLEENLCGSFNNPEASDAKVQIEEQDIHLHRWVVAKGSEVLAKRWKPEWNASGTSLDSFLGCDSCGIQPSHTSALMFFQFFYTGAVTWSETDSDTASARELLVMASVCQVPHVMCEAETKLSRVMSLKNCCELLQVADHHDAQQLRKYCLHFIASMPDSVRDTEGYGCLSLELVREVETKRNVQKLL